MSIPVSTGSGGHGPCLANEGHGAKEEEDDDDEGVALFRASPIGRRAGGRLAKGALPQLASDLILHAALLRGVPHRDGAGLATRPGAGWGLSGHVLVELRADGHGGVEGGVLQPGACSGVTDVVLYLRTSSENHAKGPGGEERPNLYRHLAVAVRAAEDLLLGGGDGEGDGEGVAMEVCGDVEDDGGGGNPGTGDGDPADAAQFPPLRGILVAEVSSAFTNPMGARGQLGAVRVAASRVITRKGKGAAVIVAPSPSRLGRTDLPEVVAFLTQDGARVVVKLSRKLADELTPGLVAAEMSGDFVSLSGLERVISAGSVAQGIYTARVLASIAVAWRMDRRGSGASGTYDDAAREALKGRFRGLRDARVVCLSRVSPLGSILGDSAGSSSIESQFAFARLYLGDVLCGPWVGWSAQYKAGSSRQERADMLEAWRAVEHLKAEPAQDPSGVGGVLLVLAADRATRVPSHFRDLEVFAADPDKGAVVVIVVIFPDPEVLGLDVAAGGGGEWSPAALLRAATARLPGELRPEDTGPVFDAAVRAWTGPLERHHRGVAAFPVPFPMVIAAGPQLEAVCKSLEKHEAFMATYPEAELVANAPGRSAFLPDVPLPPATKSESYTLRPGVMGDLAAFGEASGAAARWNMTPVLTGKRTSQCSCLKPRAMGAVSE